MNRGNVLLRVDGNSQTGYGRVTRCLALANALQRRRYQMTFVGNLDSKTWADRIGRFRHGVDRIDTLAGTPEDQADLLLRIDQKQPAILVTDGGTDERFLADLTHRVPLVISLDHQPSHRLAADLVLCPFLGRASRDFDIYPGSQVLAGPKYAMIRSEFRRARNVRATEPGGPNRVLVALGGGDNAAAAAVCAQGALASKMVDNVQVVLGSGGDPHGKLAELKRKHPEKLRVVGDVRDLGPRMTKAHLLVTGGGNTALEAACVGIPTLMVQTHDHQFDNATWLEELGVSHLLGAPDQLTGAKVKQFAEQVLGDKFERKTMSRAGRNLIDGRGPDRMVTASEVLLERSRVSRPLAAAA